MNLELKDRVALISGASSGIGKATAMRLAREGACVGLTYHTRHDEAEDIAGKIRAEKGEAFVVRMDLASFASIETAVRSVQQRWGRLHILVNNAFDFGPRRIADTPIFPNVPSDEWQQRLRINIEGTLRVTQVSIPFMQEAGWGRILNVSSTLAEDGRAGAVVYSTVKSALRGFTRSLSKELGPLGILVNTVMPGLTATDRLSLISQEVRNRVESTVPIRRILSPEDIADVIAFLCSARNAAITGEIVRVSGGRM